MKFIKWLNEKSYTQKDLPENFFVVFELNEIYQDLLNQKIGGLKGISDKEEIQFQFLGVGRDSMLTIPSKDLLKNNNITRIMYDNPYYLVSKNMWALKRLFNASKTKWVRHVIGNIFDHMLVVLKKEGDKKFENFYQDAEHNAISNVKREGYKYFERIDSIKDLAKAINNYVNKVFSEESNRTYNVSIKDWENLLYKTLKRIGNVYQEEGEWVVKNDSLIVPKSSKLYILWPSGLNQKALDYMKDVDLEDKENVIQGLIDNNIIDELDEISWDMSKFSSHKKAVEKYIKIQKLSKIYNVEKLDKDEFEKKRMKYFERKK